MYKGDVSISRLVMRAFKGDHDLVAPMKRWLVILSILMMLGCTMPVNSGLLDEELSNSLGSSQATITFANGPDESEVVKGLYTLQFSIGGTGTITSILIEKSSDSGNNWTPVTNLTSTPWLTQLDTTALTNGTWVLRATAWDSDVDENITSKSGNFTIANQIPVITGFSVTDAETGSGNNADDRAWFAIESSGWIEFSWSATDDDLSHATLANVPGPGSPSQDGPGALSNSWNWSSGDMDEGIWNPRLTVYDDSGLSETKTIFIGIDRTGPSMNTPTIGDGSTWSDSTEVGVSGLISSADDGTGSGVSSTSVILPDASTWTDLGSASSTQLSLTEGTNSVGFRAIDNAGNIGDRTDVSIKVDVTNPIIGNWALDELNTAKVGNANVSIQASDALSGVDEDESYIEYGFDSNGVGSTPDLTGRWLRVGTSGLEGVIGLSSWATKARQYLALRAVVVDNAGNEVVSPISFNQILPGIDLSWNLSQTGPDRLVVRPGETYGIVGISSVIETNMDWGGGVTVFLQSAPADRSSSVTWTTIESKVLANGAFSDSTETLNWNYTVPNTGQWDLRLVIDPSNNVDERDEGNNAHHMVVTGVNISGVNVVPSFGTSIWILILVGLLIGFKQRKRFIPPTS